MEDDGVGGGRRRVWWRVGLLVAAGVIALAVVAGERVLFPTPRFPQPAGPYGIGARVYDWTDASREEPFTAERGDHRRIVAQIWYPADGNGPTRPYIDNDAVADALAGHLHLPGWLFRNIQHAPTHAVTDAPAASGPFPVLLNPTGFSGFRSASLFWIEELTSQGYVVVTLDQPGTAAVTVYPDGRVIPLIADKARFDELMPLALLQAPDQTPEMNGVPLPGGIIPFLADDLSFVLDQLAALNRDDPALAGRLDLDHVGVFGMSLGGYVSAEACHRDPRFRACLAVDSGHTADVVREGLSQPMMVISRDAEVMRQERARAGGWPEDEVLFTTGSQRGLFAHNRGDAYFATMNEMFHVNWTDAPIWTPLIGWMGLAGPIDPYKGFAETNALTLAFFNRTLKAQPAPLLDAPPPPGAHWQLETRRARSLTPFIP
ncbi:MAG: hypothetical protein QM692_14820 [Thermomicrobiales bacterium]